MPAIEPHQPADEYARGAHAVLQRIGDLMVTIENDTHRGVINALYLRLLAEGVPPHPDPVDTRITRMGELALRAFGADLTRDVAAGLLVMWSYYASLSPAEIEAILAAFPEPGPEPMPGGGWISGPSTGGPHTGGADQ